MGTKSTTLTTYRGGVAVDTQVITWETTAQEDNEESIRGQASQALAGNKTFVALPSPSNAQVVAQVKDLSRQNNRIIRLLLGLFDGTD